MHAWMLSMLGRRRTSNILTYYESTVWVAPQTTNKVTVAGNGAPGTAGTTGASTTALGKTFPGGTNGLATVVTYPNVAVTPGSQYLLTIPTGGSVTLVFES